MHDNVDPTPRYWWVNHHGGGPYRACFVLHISSPERYWLSQMAGNRQTVAQTDFRFIDVRQSDNKHQSPRIQSKRNTKVPKAFPSLAWRSGPKFVGPNTHSDALPEVPPSLCTAGMLKSWHFSARIVSEHEVGQLGLAISTPRCVPQRHPQSASTLSLFAPGQNRL